MARTCRVTNSSIHRPPTTLAELHGLLSRLSAPEIGNMLETLPPEEALFVWKQIPRERENDILWEVER